MEQPMIVSGTEYLSLPSAPETWLIEGLLPTSGSMLLYGDPKVGKSFAALQLAACLTSGVEWLGFNIPQAVNVVYVQLDTPRTLWKARIKSLAESGLPVEGVHFADRETLGTFPFDILEPKHFAKLVAALQNVYVLSEEGDPVAVEPGVVIIDTLRESHSADENDSTEMQEAIANLEAAVKPAALIIVSHAKKANPEQGFSLMNDNRGSNYIVGRMDAIVRFNHKGLRVSSRTLEEHSITLERNDDGTWVAPKDPVKQLAEELLAARKGVPIRTLAHELQASSGKSYEACRAILRRLYH